MTIIKIDKLIEKISKATGGIIQYKVVPTISTQELYRKVILDSSLLSYNRVYYGNLDEVYEYLRRKYSEFKNL